MSKAEEKYPIDGFLPWDTHEKSLQLARREGYEQAEKDTMEWVRHYILSHDTVDIFQMEDAFNDEWRNKK